MSNMITAEYTCIMCPNGCRITVQYSNSDGETSSADPAGPAVSAGQTAGAAEPVIYSLEGNLCPRGRSYVLQELTDPRRNIATSIAVVGGELPLTSVRLTMPIPKDRIFDAMAQIRRCKVTAPVKAGTVVIRDLLDLGCDVIVTKTVGAEVRPAGLD